MMAVMVVIKYYSSWIGNPTGFTMVGVWGHEWGNIGVALIEKRTWGFVHLPTHMVIGREGLWFGLSRLEDAIAAAVQLNAVPGIDSHNPSEDTRRKARNIAITWLEADGNPGRKHDGV